MNPSVATRTPLLASVASSPVYPERGKPCPRRTASFGRRPIHVRAVPSQLLDVVTHKVPSSIRRFLRPARPRNFAKLLRCCCSFPYRTLRRRLRKKQPGTWHSHLVPLMLVRLQFGEPGAARRHVHLNDKRPQRRPSSGLHPRR